MLRVGTILHGTYRIESYLASGGFGNTYLAKNIEFDEIYAIKEFFVKGVCQRDGDSTTISVSNAENTNSFTQQREKFKKEARRLRTLNNPHIVKVYDLFEENGTAYYVMDYVDGESLSTRLKRTQTPLSETAVRNYLTQILDGLEAIHAAGIWHLDIKPANIMVDSHYVVKLIDFGASKQQSTAGGATASTGISYTNGYAPSEQMAQSYDKFGPWTDFYALGATMYKLFTNQDPPSVTDLSEDETEDKHLALPMPNVSEEMRKLVVWMMQVNRLKRPKNVGEIRDFLQQSSATSKSEETKAYSSCQSYANPVSGDEETVWAGKNGDAKVEENEQPQSKIKEQASSDTASKNTHFVVVFILVIVVVCAIAFMTRGCGNLTTTATNVLDASADSDVVSYSQPDTANLKILDKVSLSKSPLQDDVKNEMKEQVLEPQYMVNGKYYIYVMQGFYETVCRLCKRLEQKGYHPFVLTEELNGSPTYYAAIYVCDNPIQAAKKCEEIRKTKRFSNPTVISITGLLEYEYESGEVKIIGER